MQQKLREKEVFTYMQVGMSEWSDMNLAKQEEHHKEFTAFLHSQLPGQGHNSSYKFKKKKVHHTYISS